MFGLVQDDEAIVYREWVPAAKAVHLIGRSHLQLCDPSTLPAQPTVRLSPLRCLNQYDKWSMILTGAAIVPAGDFNGWSWETPLERGEYGVWSVRLPHGASCSLPLIIAALGCCLADSMLRPLQLSCCAHCCAQLPANPRLSRQAVSMLCYCC